MSQRQHTKLHAAELPTYTTKKQSQKKSNQTGPRRTQPEISRSEGDYPEIWSVSHLVYMFQISRPGDTFRDEYRVSPAECCTFWNLGFECIARRCEKWHVCCYEGCLTSFHTEHRAVQHFSQPDCAQHAERLLGMNFLFPQAMTFDDRSSVADTLEACSRYGIKPPSLNADRFEELLRKTGIDEDLQASLVRGWREGFSLGSKLQDKSHYSRGPRTDEIKEGVLRAGLSAEVNLGRMHGPLKTPLNDGRWFVNYWVSPYFVIPKHTPEGEKQKWRLIHHLSFHNSGDRSKSLNGHINLEDYPTYFPTPETGAHLVFCCAPLGSALLGRDIKDYYRNFLLNPYTWWKTYTYALGGYWFNPYLPFGGSSCTSIAQRQSDAIRAVMEVSGVQALMIAMLDDFLIVCPRALKDTDESVLRRGRAEGEAFDRELKALGLPKAVSKDQKAAFTTIWCGIKYHSKETVISVPEKKWIKFKNFMHTNLVNEAGELRGTITAGILRTMLGKMCHMTRVWAGGRPSLYPLWRLLFTAKFIERDKLNLVDKQEILILKEDCMFAVTLWLTKVSREGTPMRRILPCNRRMQVTWVTLLRFACLDDKRRHGVFVGTPEVSWCVDEWDHENHKKDLPICWLTQLLEAVSLVMEDGPITGLDVILVRTNIRKMKKMLEANLYLRSIAGMEISCKIHEKLAHATERHKGKPTKEECPTEIRCVLLELDEIAVAECIARLEGDASL